MVNDADKEEAFNAGDERQVSKARTKAGRQAKRDGDVVRDIMSTKAGRAWMYRFLEGTHIFNTSFRRDAMEMCFVEGERNIGLKMLADIQRVAPDQYSLMIKEGGEE